MGKEKKEKSTLTIWKDEGFSDHRCLLGLDKEREDEFNLGGKIEVTEEEFELIKNYRWLKCQKS